MTVPRIVKPKFSYAYLWWLYQSSIDGRSIAWICGSGSGGQKVMTLATSEFIRRFLIHVLPRGLPPHPSLRTARQRHARRQHRPSARTARRAGGTARDRGYQLRRGQRAQAARAPVSVLRRPHGHHREVRARLLAAPSAGGVPNRDQDRHLMIAAMGGNITTCESIAPALDRQPNRSPSRQLGLQLRQHISAQFRSCPS
jgi:hypothetical protein